MPVKVIVGALVLLMSGCMGQTILSGGAFPEGAAVYRCTEYEGTVAGTWTNTAALAQGCQCMQLGAELSGTVEIVGGENCKMTFRGNQ